jgi:hypothetical protein
MQTFPITDADIFVRTVVPPGGCMTHESAVTILQWQFSPAAHEEMRELLEKNSDDTITAAERETLERYRRVGQLINVLQAQAKLALAGESVTP